MLETMLLGMALLAGQAGQPAPDPAVLPIRVPILPSPQLPDAPPPDNPAPREILGAPAPPVPAPLARPASVAQPVSRQGEPAAPEPAPIDVPAPVLPAVVPPAPPTPGAAATAATPIRWFTMKALQGTWLGAQMDENRIAFSGWTNGSFTASTARVSNQPVVWNDRANEFLLQQQWFRLERSIVTNSTTPSWGFRIDVLTGSDYRFTLPRGLLNSQLENSQGNQNLYGVDPIQHYINYYIPTFFKGMDIRVGRLYTPWGVESLEAVSTPLPSRSYAFNWSPPFTHFGAGSYVTFNDVWSGVAMIVNGNDVYIGDPSEEARFVGNIKWTQPGGGRNTVTLAASIGRGKFNAGAPFAPATVGLATEPLGRNNFNAFDVVYTHTFNPVLSYNLEAIYAYQTSAPDVFNPSGFGYADWYSFAHYLFFNMSPRVTGIMRYENFEDSVGQRTGFPGLYTALSGGLQFRLRPDVILRPELRYDYNGNSTPFEGKHGIFTATADFIIRW